ncbi:laminin subunit beta-3-like isoform X2 [Salvelinus namaycush]|uniref:Laminin subunit beta-3-like isoform X2 n=1 Tax=Salvelinus namaycush TaxID=8040 RepID=A0A8U1H5J3_SALNM|nr:laminin subunit beta-3-like isoform X2 [Salvelinus namaycush]XP_038869320.1 laminin subunit beta-3-like isoform X2 [Salvelinus namaycush]
MWILFQLAALTAVAATQRDCSRGACYPPMGDLLLGRDRQLHASSTCGLAGSEVFCTYFGQWRIKCCTCDSRNPSSQLAHTIQNILSTTGPNRWWQARKDVSPVTLQLDLQNLFQLDTIILTFKGPHPSALVVERTLDNGQTWQPSHYMASDCRSAFPGIAMTMPRSLDQTYCYTLPPVPANSYQDQTIQFSPLRQFSSISVPNGQKIQEVSGLTGLRVKLTELGAISRLPGRTPSLFYALREMRVMGTCLCHGHANRCLQDTTAYQLPSTQVSAQCECQHNTAGVNCERCADLYNDLPWRSAEEGNTHTCKRCECNNHAQRCRFDPSVYEASGWRSGGVCEGCQHHTTGPKCDRCAPGYQPNHRSSIDQPDACTRCHCSAEGAENGGRCDDVTGSCRCKMGYYGLTTSNPLGCTKCLCSAEGSLSSVCDPVSGQCPCRPYHQGLTCELCSRGYWNPSSFRGCEPCRCDPTNSHGDTCDRNTGQCQCRSGFGGRTCTECPDNTYGDPLIGCRPCQCAAGGMVPGGCDKRTGACRCRIGVIGIRCDACSRGHVYSFPDCEVCPSCFFSLDSYIQNLTLGLERLSTRIPSRPGGSLPTGLRIQALEATLIQIRDSLPLPTPSTGQVNDALFQLRRLRDQLDQVDGDLSPQGRGLELGSQLDELQALLGGLGLLYNAKRDALRNPINSNNAGAFSSIKNAYDESTDAAKIVEASGKTVDQSSAVREDSLDLQNQVQPANTRDLEKLNQQLNTKPDLSPTAKQVCGSVRSSPCTPAQCDGELCPAEGAPPCGRGESCIGALPLGTRAVRDAEEVKDRLQQLNGKITQAAAQIQKTQDTVNMVRQSTDDLANQMRRARDDLEADLQETRYFVKELKDFLSDPSSDPTDISTVSEWILNAKLPLSLAALKRKLQEIRALAAGLPDSKAVLDQAGPQLDTARRLLQEAQDARDAGLGVKDDVDGLLDGFTAVEGSLSGLNDKVQDSLDIVEDISNSLTQTKAQLTPAVKALGEASTLAEGMKPQLEGLKALVRSGDLLAQNAKGEANKANKEADAATRDLASLEKQLEQLRAAERTSGHGDGTGTTGERLRKLQEEAGSLAQDTGDMMKALAGKADSLHRLQDEVLLKSQRLTGLDGKLRDLLADMRQKVKILSTCQG